MIDNTQPDHIVDMHEMVVDNSLDVIFDKMGYTKNTDFRKEAIRLIADWHNKQTEAEGEELDLDNDGDIAKSLTPVRNGITWEPL